MKTTKELLLTLIKEDELKHFSASILFASVEEEDVAYPVQELPTIREYKYYGNSDSQKKKYFKPISRLI